MKNRMTLKELLTKYKGVHIPQLQRDYAQGRKERKEIRKTFVHQLIDTLEKGEHLNLDFIYGYVREDIFYPLDGQQRLTTLWLFHWYLSPTEEIKECMGRFGYRTRISAERFCNLLVSNTAEISRIGVKESIRDSRWFRDAWAMDPTVSGMLTMLDEVENQIKIKDKSIDQLFDQLREEPITFDLIDISSEKFKLTDELYIKMNARGKLLTPFEQYKANLLKGLQNYKPEWERFMENIDSKWVNLFWTPDKGADQTDAEMINFFNSIAQLCHFRQNIEKGKEHDEEDFVPLQSYIHLWEKENAIFLMDILDLLCKIKGEAGSIDSFFEQLQKGLNLFEEEQEERTVHLFAEMCRKKVGVRRQIIFLFMAEYMLKHNITSCTEEVKDLARIVRNLLARKKQLKDLLYTTNVRIKELHRYWSDWSSLIENGDVYETLSRCQEERIDAHEIEKANLIINHPELKKHIHKLEEHPLLMGQVEVVDLKLDGAELERRVKTFYELWSLLKKDDEHLVTQALIAKGFGGVEIKEVGNNRYETWFFGRGVRWNTLLTATDKLLDKCKERNFKTILNALLDTLTKTTACGEAARDTLREIVNEYLVSEKWRKTGEEWRYYFCKYDAIIAQQYPDYLMYKNFGYFAWGGPEGADSIFIIRTLGSTSNMPLVAYHHSIFAIAVNNEVQKGGDNAIKECELLGELHTRKGHDICLAGTLYISSTEKGWEIEWTEAPRLDKVEVTNVLLKYAESSDVEGTYLLKDVPRKDYVELCVDFCNAVLEHIK